MRPTRHVQALNGYVHKNLKTNKRPKRPHQVPLQVRQRKPQTISRTGSCVAPYKPTTPNPLFWQQDYYCPLQTICQKVNHATNGTGYKLCSTLRQGNRFQDHSVGWRKGGQRESVLPQATDTTTQGLL